MDINQLIVGNEYRLTHAYGQPSQKVRVLKVEEKNCSKWGKKYWSALVIYTSDDCTKGLKTEMNTIECERYLWPI
jgi:hypothetical protein